MKKNNSLFLFIALCISASGLFAQGKLRLSVVTVSDTAPKLGDVVTVFANLQNIDTIQSYTGVISFGVASQTQVLTNANILSSPPYTGTQITLAPKEAIPALFTITVDKDYFKVGPDIIVIWPKAIGTMKDSIFIPINIQQILGVGNTDAKELVWSINESQLIIQSGNENTALKQVRIFSVNGALLLNQFIETNPAQINIEHLPKGIYICEMMLENRVHKIVKFAR